MRNNDLLCFDGSVYRILDIDGDDVLVIDCITRHMPMWIAKPTEYTECTEEELLSKVGISLPDGESLSQCKKAVAHRRYTLIEPVLSVVEDVKCRTAVIDLICNKNKISKPTFRKYLCLFLAFQNIYILSGNIDFKPPKSLSCEQKTFRWALNRFYYTSRRNSLKTAYTLMLKEKYCDENGKLLSEYPPFHRFYYFYRTNRKVRNQIISREGLSNYQRNYRPLWGEGVREFCPTVGYGMVDSTVCDIYLINECGQLVGRPILTACIDAYSSMCMGYSLEWEGGIHAVNKMFQNVITDKVVYCKKFGIDITADDWNCSALPAVLITDRGREYTGSTMEHLTELGITIMNLDGYRAELKGNVEKFFDIVQNLYKPYLKGKGVVDIDFQERGSKDYRKEACLTIADFEKIVVRCILYYNSQRIIEKLPYTENYIKPYAKAIWNEFCSQGNLISVKSDLLYKTLLTRTDNLLNNLFRKLFFIWLFFFVVCIVTVSISICSHSKSHIIIRQTEYKEDENSYVITYVLENHSMSVLDDITLHYDVTDKNTGGSIYTTQTCTAALPSDYSTFNIIINAIQTDDSGVSRRIPYSDLNIEYKIVKVEWVDSVWLYLLIIVSMAIVFIPFTYLFGKFFFVVFPICFYAHSFNIKNIVLRSLVRILFIIPYILGVRFGFGKPHSVMGLGPVVRDVNGKFIGFYDPKIKMPVDHVGDIIMPVNKKRK